MDCFLNDISDRTAPTGISAVNHCVGIKGTAGSLPVSILQTPKAVGVKRDISCIQIPTQVSQMPTYMSNIYLAYSCIIDNGSNVPRRAFSEGEIKRSQKVKILYLNRFEV